MVLDIIIICALLILGLALLMAEIFLLPGITIAGIAGAVALVSSVIYAFIYMGDTAGYVTMAISVVATAGTVVYLIKSKAMDRIALTTNIDGTVDQTDIQKISVGDRGVTASRLNPIGKANFDEVVVEAKSVDGEYIDEGVEVEVVRIENNVLVQKVD